MDVATHAIERYIERIDPAATPAQAREDLRAALRGGKKLHNQGRDRAHYAVHGSTYRIVTREENRRPVAILTVLFMADDGTHNELPDEEPEGALYTSDTSPRPTWPTPPPAPKPVVYATSGQRHFAEVRAKLDATHENEKRHLEEALAAALARGARHLARGDEANDAKVRAWTLLVACLPHVPSDLADAIRAELPPIFIVNRQQNKKETP